MKSSDLSSPKLNALSEKAQDALLAEVWAEANQLINARAADLARGYQPYGAAADLRAARDREVLLCGPAGTGKSRGVLEWINELCWEYPGIRVLIARKTRVSMTESTLYTFEEHVLPPNSPLKEGVTRANRHSYDYPNGSQIILGGLDKPSRLFSTEFDLVFVPEAIETTLDDWESLLRCLRHYVLPWQQMIGDTNPDRPTHWLKERCDSGLTRLISSSHQDNPVLFDHTTGEWTPRGIEYLSKLDALTGARKARLRYGKWAQAEGAVYEDFDPNVHQISPFPIPADWRRIRVIDFGFTNPFVCQWWAIDHDGRMYLYREIYQTGSLVEDQARRILELSKGEYFEATPADWDAEDRATLERHGLRTVEARKDITVGIQAVQARLRIADDGKPRLFIFRDVLLERDQALADVHKPVCTADEFVSYVWPKSAAGKAVKEQPVKEYDHGMDAMRYAVMYVDNPQAMRPAPRATIAKRTVIQPDRSQRSTEGIRAMVAPPSKRRSEVQAA